MGKTNRILMEEKRQQDAEKETELTWKPLASIPTDAAAPGGTSRQQVLADKKAREQAKRAGKMIASSSAMEEDEDDEDDEEEDPAPLKRARKSTGKEKEKRPYANRDRSKKPTPAVFLDFLKKGITWTATRFGDVELMKEIGIDEDVQGMMANMSMSGFYGQAHPTYADLSSEFLASLVASYHQSEHAKYGWGKIAFKVKGKAYCIGFRDIGKLLGLKDAADFHLPKLRGVPKEDSIPAKVGNVITGAGHSTGSDKSSAIRNPAIRYLHRMLVHAFFPRKEPGNVTEDDLKLLCQALAPFAPDEIPFSVGELYRNFGMVGFFVTRLEYYRDWAWSTGDSDPQIGIGGMITPLLEFAKIDLRCDAAGPTFLDGTHMKISQYFSGRYYGACVYTYRKLGKAVEVVLPNKSITSLALPGVVKFDIPDEYFLGSHGKLGPMSATKRRQSVSRAQWEKMHQEEIGETVPEGLYGPPRYHFEPYSGALAHGPLRDAHNHIGKLRRWNKAQDRTIFKLKKKCKELSRAMKQQAQTTAKFMRKVSEVLTRGAIAGCSAADFDLGDVSAPRPPPPADPWALGFPLTARQIRRKNRNPDIFPSSSGNKSPSLASTDNGEDSEEEATASTRTP